jgi:oligoendopeptidase F
MEITGAEHIHWNLDDLYTDDASLKADLAQIAQQAQAFSEVHRGKMAHYTATEWADALHALEGLQDTLGKAYTFAYLHWSTHTTDATRGALLQFVKEQYTQISQNLIFFEIEWAAVPESEASALLNEASLARFKHYLEVQQEQKKHLLTESEEKILAEKSVTGASAWNRYFDETLGSAVFSFRGEEKSEQEVLSKLSDSDRSVRHDAAKSLAEGLQQHLRTLTFIFNTILADKASNDRLRGYESWVSSRNVSNEATDETVQALIDAVTSRYDLVHRYYKLKKKQLGLDEMMDYDRYAPISETETRYTWEEARQVVTEAYTEFHPEMGRIVNEFFEKNWIDAALGQGKRGGAFSHGAVPSVHPYILMNFTGRVRDVQTLAHELGHGVHQYLSRVQGVYHADTPLTTAETASVFGEMLTFQRLLQRETNDQGRLAMYMEKIDDTFATVFRQVTMNRFEDAIHTTRREKGELTSEQFSSLWMETQSKMFGDSVTLGEHYAVWWSYIPHFLHTPGYVYAYAFGELLVLALYEKYRQEGAPFTQKYVDLLTAGGSDYPHVLVGKLGIDLTDQTFWHQGLKSIEALIEEAEKLALTA